MKLSQVRWPSLARDLAIMSAPDSPLQDIDQVAESYHISVDDIRKLLLLPEFQGMVKDELARVKAEGGRAGAVYRFATLSQSLAEKLYNDAMGPMESKDAIKFLELILKCAGFMDTKEAQVNTQVNVGVHLPLPQGLSNKKLAHLEAAG